MDIYTSLTNYVATLPIVRDWPDMKATFDMAAANRPHPWSLPAIACEAVGGPAEDVIPAVAAIACAYTGIILIDDLLDEDPRGAYHRIGVPAAANLGAAFQVAAAQAVLCSAAAPQTKLAALHSLSDMLLSTAQGQHEDAQNPADEAAYWRVVQRKSSPFYAAALQLGGLLGDASLEVAGGLYDLGALYGEMIQVHDDLKDTMATPANSDWTLGRSPLPILYAQVVDHPDRARFLELRRQAHDPDCLAEAQAILIRCGAVSYCVDGLLRRYEKAGEMLAGAPLHEKGEMEKLFTALIQPVWALFESLGVESQTSQVSKTCEVF